MNKKPTKRVTVRDFAHAPLKYLQEMPLVLTHFSVEIAQITPIFVPTTVPSRTSRVQIRTDTYSNKERLPEDKQLPLHKVCYYLEDTLQTKIVNWPKQAKAFKMMTDAGYNERQMMFTIKHMSKDEFYDSKGFDLMTVANNIDKVKASVRKQNG